MKIYFLSLGCDKNLADSSHMLGLLSKEYEITDICEDADIAFVNTCAFINDAKEESVNTILELAELKKNNLKFLVISGCLSQRYYEDLKNLIPEIDGFLGISAINNVLSDLQRIVAGEKVYDLPDINLSQHIVEKRFMAPPFHYAYLKIAEGCDKKCSYCSIPNIRGNYRSIPKEELIKEAKYLAENGASELILVAQETTVYGQDLYNEKYLPKLLNELSEIEGIEWIRVLYAYPEEIDDNLIEVIKTNRKVCKYLDIPIQHSSDSILLRMGRRTSNEDLRRIISKLRKEIPDIALRTSLITGFPGETEEDHRNLIDFVKEIGFDKLGVFKYSREEGTLAYNFDNQVKASVKTRRQKEIMKLQAEISMELNSKFKDRVMKAIIDGYDPQNDVYIGRIYRDAPDVDGCVFIENATNLISGSFVNVHITDYDKYDLIGEICDESCE